MVAVALAIKADSKGPILFKQVRVGRQGRKFNMYKFRSMVDGADEMQQALAGLNQASGPLFKVRDDPRRTRVGRWLRRFSLDELAQLYNVLRGEMSLIGPRPNLPQEVEHYEEWHKKRLVTMPGITLHTPMSQDLSAGIVCFEVAGRSPDQVVTALRRRGIVASVTPYATQYARMAPGLLNSPAEIETVLKEIRALAG